MNQEINLTFRKSTRLSGNFAIVIASNTGEALIVFKNKESREKAWSILNKDLQQFIETINQKIKDFDDVDIYF